MVSLDLVPRAHEYAIRLHRQHMNTLCKRERLVLELPLGLVFIFRCLVCNGYWEVAEEEALTCPPT